MTTTSTISEPTIAEVKSKNPGVELQQLSASLKDGSTVAVIIKPPSEAAWKVFRGLGVDPGQKLLAPRMLVDECVVWPERAAFAEIIASHPGLVETFAGQLVEIAGVTEAVTVRKL